MKHAFLNATILSLWGWGCNGAFVLRIVEMPFDEEGWPVPGGP